MTRPTAWPIPSGPPAAPTTMYPAIQADLDALRTSHKGSGAPGYVAAGTIWIDDSATPWVVNVSDGTDVIPIGTINPTTNVFRASRAVDLDGTLAMTAALVINGGTVSGNNTYVLELKNPGSGVNTEVTVSGAPNNQGRGVRDGQIGFVEQGSNQTGIVFRTANAGAPTARLWIGYDGSIYPAGDNTQTLGKSGNRFSVVYAGTSAINTSDATMKKWLGQLPEQELAALRACDTCYGAYQMLDAIAEKGEGHARIHFGIRAQDAIKIFEDHGLDPWRYAWFCRDPKVIRVEKKRTVQQPVMETITVPEPRIEIVEGKAVRSFVGVEQQQAKVTVYPLVDEDGNELGTYQEPVLENVEVTYEEEQVVEGEWVYGVRYQEFDAAVAWAVRHPPAA